MKFTLNWLKQYLDTDKTPAELADKLSLIGLEVEELIDPSETLKPFIVAEVLDAKPHPDADKLQVLSVSIGEGEPLQVVCGAPNAKKGLKGILARPGDMIPAFGEKIKKAKVRGVESCGMMCSMRELQLGQDHDGIIELDANAPVGTSAADVLKYEVVFDAEVTPNRPDYLGVKGIARDLAASGMGTMIDEQFDPVKSSIESVVSLAVADDAKEVCSYIGGIYSEIKRNPVRSGWIGDLLSAVGMNPKNFLVDVTNFMTLDSCRPMHAFDVDKLSGNLTVRQAKEGEKFVGLDGVEYTLTSADTVVADDKGVQLLSGIMGAKSSGCDENTKNVFLIAETLDPVAIRRTARRHNIQSDAKFRFERGVDPASVGYGLSKATHMMNYVCKGEVSGLVEAGAVPSDDRSISYDLKSFKQLIGIDIPSDIAVNILTVLGCDVTGTDVLTVVPPSYRQDLKEVHDITEELIRIWGYDKIVSQTLDINPVVKPVLLPAQTRLFQVKRLLASIGMNEALSWSFVSGKLEEKLIGQTGVRISNPITPDHDVLRQTGLSSLLPFVSSNQARGQLNLQLFECAPIFNGINPGDQEMVVTGVMSGESQEKSWDKREHAVDVMDAKEALFTVLDRLGLSDKVQLVTDELIPGVHPYRSARVLLGKFEIARFGEVHPMIIKDQSIKTGVAFFELFIDRIPLKAKKGTAKQELQTSAFQGVRRDFAFMADEDFKSGDLIKAVKKLNPQLITDVYLFDVYQGEKLNGKKSLAITVVMQPMDKTLTDADIELVAANVMITAEDLGLSLR